jgi:hypothetical protein
MVGGWGRMRGCITSAAAVLHVFDAPPVVVAL